MERKENSYHSVGKIGMTKPMLQMRLILCLNPLPAIMCTTAFKFLVCAWGNMDQRRCQSQASKPDAEPPTDSHAHRSQHISPTNRARLHALLRLSFGLRRITKACGSSFFIPLESAREEIRLSFSHSAPALSLPIPWYHSTTPNV